MCRWLALRRNSATAEFLFYILAAKLRWFRGIAPVSKLTTNRGFRLQWGTHIQRTVTMGMPFKKTRLKHIKNRKMEKGRLGATKENR
jgi:hypothetical protein